MHEKISSQCSGEDGTGHPVLIRVTDATMRRGEKICILKRFVFFHAHNEEIATSSSNPAARDKVGNAKTTQRAQGVLNLMRNYAQNGGDIIGWRCRPSWDSAVECIVGRRRGGGWSATLRRGWQLSIHPGLVNKRLRFRWGLCAHGNGGKRLIS